MRSGPAGGTSADPIVGIRIRVQLISKHIFTFQSRNTEFVAENFQV